MIENEGEKKVKIYYFINFLKDRFSSTYLKNKIVNYYYDCYIANFSS